MGKEMFDSIDVQQTGKHLIPKFSCTYIAQIFLSLGSINKAIGEEVLQRLSCTLSTISDKR